MQSNLQAAAPELCPMESFSNPSTSGNNANGWFSIVGSEFDGEFLIIRYTVRYPGMTKVKMFGSNGTFLWRGQYVNQVEGEHKLVLRKKYMDNGSSYTFEFEYKSHVESFEITL